METQLLALMGITAFLILVSCVVVAMATPICRKGWKFEMENKENPPVEDAYDDRENAGGKEAVIVSAKVSARHPLAIGPGDLSPGDVVHIETQSGSKYAFEMRSPELGLYHLRGSSASRKKYFDMEVVVDRDFTPGGAVVFWSVDRQWRGVSTPVKRLLVDRCDSSAATQ